MPLTSLATVHDADADKHVPSVFVHAVLNNDACRRTTTKQQENTLGAAPRRAATSTRRVRAARLQRQLARAIAHRAADICRCKPGPSILKYVFLSQAWSQAGSAFPISKTSRHGKGGVRLGKRCLEPHHCPRDPNLIRLRSPSRPLQGRSWPSCSLPSPTGMAPWVRWPAGQGGGPVCACAARPTAAAD